jgi:glucose/arabinose dehydrogenase
MLTAVAVTLATAPLAAQQPQQPPPQQPQPPDTVKVPQFRIQPPISPLGAMWRSLLLPGWGQSLLNRRATGAVFIFWEGITLTMTVKSVQQLRYQERVGAETVEDKRDEVQDWAVLLAFNHLLAGAEAFVAAQLWDFPGELEAQAMPDGSLGAGLRVRF